MRPEPAWPRAGGNEGPLASNNGPVWQIGDEIVTGMAASQSGFRSCRKSLHAADADLDARQQRRRAHRVEASYLAGKLSWNADYVLTVARDDKAADLDGWVTLTNGSGDVVQEREAAARRGRSESRARVLAR